MLKKTFFLFSLFVLAFFSLDCFAQEKITFASKDGLMMTADWYKIDNTSFVIILCHQAGYSRGEYIETAKKFNKLGFNCLAIDQRSGDQVNGIKNETAALAKQSGKADSYAYAEMDMVAAVEYVFQQYKKKVILLGSSYSASLALKITKENKKVAACVAFSPGEYFEKMNIQKTISGMLDKPIFVSSAKSESEKVKALTRELISARKIQFTPQREGVHGSRALWQDNPNNQEYWMNLKSFLNDVRD